MKNYSLLVIMFNSFFVKPQNVIPLYPNKAPGSENWNWQEKEILSKAFHSQVVYNVSQPTLTICRPAKVIANGTAVIICPG